MTKTPLTDVILVDWRALDLIEERQRMHDECQAAALAFAKAEQALRLAVSYLASTLISVNSGGFYGYMPLAEQYADEALALVERWQEELRGQALREAYVREVARPGRRLLSRVLAFAALRRLRGRP